MGWSRALVPAYALSAVAVMAAALGSLLVMETATVKLTVPSSKIVANKTITGGQSGRDLTTTRVEASVTDSQLGVGTADEVPATFATGKVDLWCSPACSHQYDLTPGTLVAVGPNYDKQYRTLTDVKVGPQADLRVSVGVTAVTPGTAGNTAAQTVNKMNACNLDCNVKVINQLAITGGVDGSAVQVIHQSDVDLARSELTTKTKQDLNAALAAQAGGLSFAADGQPALVVTSDHQVGDKVATFTMTMTASVGAVVFSETQADALMRTALTQKIPKGFQLTATTVQTTYVVLHSGANGDVTLKGSATAAVVPNVTANDLKSRIKGMRVDAAKRQLQALAPGATIEMVVKPNVPWLPVLQDHIVVTIVVEPTATV